MSSISELIDITARQFRQADLCYGHGTDNAEDEAAYLVLGALGLGFDMGGDELPRTVRADDKARLDRLVRQRIDQRVPVAYLLREAWFGGRPYYVDRSVLIPRSPVAELIATQCRPWVDAGRVRRILDIGTGSGCIAVSCALAFPGATVVAVDISMDALGLAARNAARHGVSGCVEFVQSDLFAGIAGRTFDLIIANPPYVPEAALDRLPAEYQHEPGLALAAGADGLDIVRRVLRTAAAHMTEHGVLIMEVGEQQQALTVQYPRLPFIWLEFECGGHGVFALTAAELDTWHGSIGEE